MYRSQSPGWVGCADASGLFDHAIKIIRDKFETLVLRPAIVRGPGIKTATAKMKIEGVGCAFPLGQNSLRKDASGLFFDRPLELLWASFGSVGWPKGRRFSSDPLFRLWLVGFRHPNDPAGHNTRVSKTLKGVRAIQMHDAQPTNPKTKQW